ncbi:indole-3-glycerol phosphate synthase TrpC [Neobacillus sp. MER 74]|uniref:indole-3-glycerol phosphate synthase TrpC n=1 Tax=Neobacillus sp. MER 74 TaxID=2939566 RepID=UPI002040C2C9|nr:indole-3-glycerol phosphate synthase TrpC [Neobacillus sp. MER 74]MCM3117750.1 indole-3-glycerol phosphate synthase TrpC [Neobacillus sp. MER 74]
MATILDKIIDQKKKEVRILREGNLQQVELNKPRRSFIQKLKTADQISIISEFKRASPSKGIINNTIDPAFQAGLYEEYGASAISVLTDQTFFKGSFSDLRAVRSQVNLPILCKDFIIDEVQINLAASNGADLILLITAALDDQRLVELFQYAKGLGLEVLVEVHNQTELESALKTGAKLIGVNNRDLKTFHVSLEVTENLASEVKNSGAYLISESGIHHQEDVARVRNAGANGILVGEALMKSPNVKQSFLDFRLPLILGVKK